MSDRLLEVASTLEPADANALLRTGFMLMSISPPGPEGLCWYHLGRYAGEENVLEPDWRYEAAEFLAGLDPKEVDRMALQGLSMDDEGGAAAILRVLREMLGVQDGVS